MIDFEFNPFTGELDVVDKSDQHSGYQSIDNNKIIICKDNKQMINFTLFTIDGDLWLEGDLWLA